MGLLDDAIREHLELKRRHGADPEEVSRQEREALGAPQRNEFAAPADEAAPAPDDPLAANEPEVPEGGPEVPEGEPPAAAAAVEPGYDQDPWLPDDAPEEERERVAPDEEPVGEDVLEETPEFLQETPEHDRLWFEQRAPRDFDWDK